MMDKDHLNYILKRQDNISKLKHTATTALIAISFWIISIICFIYKNEYYNASGLFVLAIANIIFYKDCINSIKHEEKHLAELLKYL